MSSNDFVFDMLNLLLDDGPRRFFRLDALFFIEFSLLLRFFHVV